jgi:hypothetical protein
MNSSTLLENNEKHNKSVNIEKLEKLLSKNGIEYNIHYAETGTIYVEGECPDGIRFKIRVSDHPPLYPDKFVVFLDVFEDGLTLKEILEEIQKGKKSDYYVGREWIMSVIESNKRFIDREFVKRARKSYEEYLKLTKNEELLKEISKLKNRIEAKTFAKEKNLKYKDVMCLKKGIRKFSVYVNFDPNKRF